VLDGLNRVPGLIRNCGGTLDDLVTWRPLHDVTCTDDAELLQFTPLEHGVARRHRTPPRNARVT
jgi:hypothetical protein